MKLTLPTACLVILMNAVTTPGREPVSYHTVRIDNLDIFDREAGAVNRAHPASTPWCAHLFAHVSADVGIIVEQKIA